MTISNTLKASILLFFCIAYTILIVVLSLANLSKVDVLKLSLSDKFYHTTCYALLTFLWLVYFRWNTNLSTTRYVYVIISIIIFGIIIEYLQLFLTNYRSFDWWDAIANTIGSLIGFIIFLWANKNIIKQNI